MFLKNLFNIFLIIIFVSFVWIFIYGLHGHNSWNIPLGYGGDLFWVFAMAKAYMTGEIKFLFLKDLSNLNAPFSANWSDFPITEEIIFFFMGILAKFSNLWFSHNIVLLTAHLSAAITFYLVSINLGSKKFEALIFSALFGLSHILFLRGSGHIILTYAWVVPLSLLIVYNFINQKISKSNIITYLFFSFIIGCFNPYYSLLFCQFLLFVSLFFYLKTKKNFLYPLICIFFTFLGFFLMNLDTFYSHFINGPNLQAVGRNLAALEVYGLKLPELFLPPSGHRLQIFSDFAMQQYYHRAYIQGESWGNYIGIIGLLSIFTLIFFSLKSLSKEWKTLEVSCLLAINWILLFSLIGGINLILGVFNFQFYRAPSRLVIFIYCILLLYLSLKCSLLDNKKIRFFLLIFILVVGLLDNLPRPNYAFQKPIAEKILSDQKMVLIMEEKLPPKSMILQLPFMEFPEVGPTKNMQDYEHFRPYLFTNNLKFSYGNNKGRGKESWKKKIKFNENENFIEDLESFGFNGIFINKKGYEKNDLEKIIKIIKKNNKTKIFENDEFIIFKIDAKKNHVLPHPEIIYNHQWSIEEEDFRWAKRSIAEITYNFVKSNQTLALELTAIKIGNISIYLNNKEIYKNILLKPNNYVKLNIDQKILLSGPNKITFKSDIQPTVKSNTEKRLVTFQLKTFLN